VHEGIGPLVDRSIYGRRDQADVSVAAAEILLGTQDAIVRERLRGLPVDAVDFAGESVQDSERESAPRSAGELRRRGNRGRRRRGLVPVPMAQRGRAADAA
jgi:hypothetical protein